MSPELSLLHCMFWLMLVYTLLAVVSASQLWPRALASSACTVVGSALDLRSKAGGDIDMMALSINFSLSV